MLFQGENQIRFFSKPGNRGSRSPGGAHEKMEEKNENESENVNYS